MLIIGVFFVVNDGAFINFCNSQVMRCVLFHSAIVNVDTHNLAHGKNVKGLVQRPQYYFFEKTCFRVVINIIYKVGVVGVDDKSCKRS